MHIDHIALYVRDLEAAKDFFERYFGARAGNIYHNAATGFRSYFLCFDDGARLELMTRGEIVEDTRHPYRTGYIHLSFGAGSAAKVDSLAERLRADGFRIVDGPRTTGDGYYEVCIEGIEGNLIEITV